MQNSYNIVDDNPNKGINYYRLKMIDKDGKFTYSNIVRVDFIKIYTITILPNPATDYVIITGADTFREIQKLDTTGKIVK